MHFQAMQYKIVTHFYISGKHTSTTDTSTFSLFIHIPHRPTILDIEIAIDTAPTASMNVSDKSDQKLEHGTW